MKLKKNHLVRFVQDIDCRDTSGPFIAKGSLGRVLVRRRAEDLVWMNIFGCQQMNVKAGQLEAVDRLSDADLASLGLGIGTAVNVRQKEGDPFDHDFAGTIKSFAGQYIVVEDQEGNCWDCDPEQLKAGSGS
jgi:hypothetical protein